MNKITQKTMFSSHSTEWETPKDLFLAIHSVMHFTLDVCATRENRKCDVFFSREDDALSRNWYGSCWMNPPYGRNETLRWMQYAYAQTHRNAASIMCLVPARTDNRWFHEYAAKFPILFMRGRLRFGGSSNSAPFPSMLVLMDDLTTTTSRVRGRVKMKAVQQKIDNYGIRSILYCPVG